MRNGAFRAHKLERKANKILINVFQTQWKLTLENNICED